jgi:hypothetical protein
MYNEKVFEFSTRASSIFGMEPGEQEEEGTGRGADGKREPSAWGMAELWT